MGSCGFAYQGESIKMIAVVDCNNFFVSCELVFHPELKGHPVMVASNNDGCIVARSPEVKALGIPMGAPAYQWKDLIRQHDIKIFSGNFALYGDLSKRVMQILLQAAPTVEIYSIDEAFLEFPSLTNEMIISICKNLRSRLLQSTGIPVSIGIGKTKTLAKIAVEIAKKNSEFQGVFSAESDKFDSFLAHMPTSDIWGIGRKLSERLKCFGIYTAKDLKQAQDIIIRKCTHLPGIRTTYELRGIKCIELQTAHSSRKGITASRSFGHPVSTYTEMAEAIALYTTRAAERLRSDKSIASWIQICIVTNYFRKDQKQYVGFDSGLLLQPTAVTSEIIKTAHILLKRIFKEGFIYKKAIVNLGGITPASQQQISMLADIKTSQRLSRLMTAVDKINRKAGRNKIHYASCGILKKKSWHPKSEMLSRRYTTSWQELPVVKAIYS